MIDPASAPDCSTASASTSRKRSWRSSESASAARMRFNREPLVASSYWFSQSSMGFCFTAGSDAGSGCQLCERLSRVTKIRSEMPARARAAALGEASEGRATRSGFSARRSSGSVDRGIWSTSAIFRASASGSGCATSTISTLGSCRATEMRSTRSSGKSKKASFMTPLRGRPAQESL